ncbi:anti-sigma factor family protein [Actinocorallia longicatena]|uniref:Putative zinc-finger domain-containing protein n=1 Tax=Actinocorallia longicatena TaxID=111803 RepID=A0ABP6Q9A2_9ACTN
MSERSEGTSTHLDYDVLADLAEGLLDETTTRAVEAHLDDCEECGRKLDDLSAVSQLLASAPMPVMPESLAAKLDEALMAEAAKAPVASLAARRRFRGYQLLSAAAAVVVVGGLGTGVVVNALNSNPNDGSQAHATLPTPQRDMFANGRARTVASGTNYQAGQLMQQIHEQLVRFNGAPSTTRPSDQLLDCVHRIAKNNPLMMVDQAKWDGEDATIVIVAPNAEAYDVWVVGDNCSASETDEVAHQQVPA